MPRPIKFFTNGQLLSRALPTAAPESAVKSNFPLWRRLRSVWIHVQVIIIFRVFDFVVSKPALQFLEVLPRVFHRQQTGLLGQLLQRSRLLLGGGIFIKEPLKLCLVPLPGLFQRITAAAGQQQPQKI